MDPEDFNEDGYGNGGDDEEIGYTDRLQDDLDDMADEEMGQYDEPYDDED